MAAAVAIGLSKTLSHCEKTRFEVMPSERRSYRSAIKRRPQHRGMSARTARTWHRGRLPSEKKGKRRWRTRPDPFAGVWAEEVEPLLRSDVEGALKATTILGWLEERHPGRFSMSQLRTLQRRLRDWRALSGPDREVYFEQEVSP